MYSLVPVPCLLHSIKTISRLASPSQTAIPKMEIRLTAPQAGCSTAMSHPFRRRPPRCCSWPRSAGWLLIWLVTGFVVFRVFDIWKPGPVRSAERSFEGGAGVMLDDVVAGLFGAVVMAALIWVLG